jgi:hypothetical protein
MKAVRKGATGQAGLGLLSIPVVDPGREELLLEVGVIGSGAEGFSNRHREVLVI